MTVVCFLVSRIAGLIVVFSFAETNSHVDFLPGKTGFLLVDPVFPQFLVSLSSPDE